MTESDIRDVDLLAGATAAVVTGVEVDRYAEEIDALLAATGAPVSARWTSLDVWLRHHARHESWAVLLRSGPDLVGAAVLARQASLGCWKITKVGEDGEQSWLPAQDERHAEQLAAAVRQALAGLGRPWFLSITDLPDPDPVAAALRAELPVSALQPGVEAPQLCFVPGADINSYLSSNTRSAVAKARNRIARAEQSTDVGWVSEPLAIDAILPEIIEVHRSRNHQLRGRSGLDEPAAVKLFCDFIQSHAQARRVRLLTVRIGTALASFAVCLVHRGTLWVYANLVSPAWLDYSAGTIANAEVVRAAYVDPTINRVDWGAGVQRYKMSGTAVLRPSQQLSAWSSTGLRLGLAVARRQRRRWEVG